MTEPDRRSRLRSATSEVHARLDEGVAKAGFFDNLVSYTGYLEATSRARQPVELALDKWGIATLFVLWPDRLIIPSLRADIRDLSGTVTASETDLLSAVVVDTKAQALGALYVLEGSALGARTLAHRAQAIGMTSTFGARHLARQTAMPNAWSSFLSILEGAKFDMAQEVECVGAAIAIFNRFERGYVVASPGAGQAQRPPRCGEIWARPGPSG